MTLLDRLDAFIEHIETPQLPSQDEKDAKMLKQWFETAGIGSKNELDAARETVVRALLKAPKNSSLRRLMLMLEEMIDMYSASPKVKVEAEPTRLNKMCSQLDVPSQERLARLVRDYVLLAPTTRSCVLSDLQSLVQLLRSGPAANVFNPNHGAAVSLEEVIHEGKILVLDLPLSDSANATRPVLLAIKLVLMNRILGRNSALCRGKQLNRERPVVIVIDEFQSLISRGRSGGEDQFMSRCREFGAISIFATQSLALLAGTIRDPSKLAALLANMRTRIFGHNTDALTCEQSAALCGASAGQDIQLAQVWHKSERLKRLVTVTAAGGNPRISPGTFSTLKTGQFIVATADGNCHMLDASGNNIMNPQVRAIP